MGLREGALLAVRICILMLPLAGCVAVKGQASSDTVKTLSLVEQIHIAHFAEPLVATAEPTKDENTALLDAIDRYNRRVVPNDRSALSEFLAMNSRSAWAASLYVNMGIVDLHEGYYSRAIDAWRMAWAQGEKAPRAKALVDRAVGELARLYASLGKNDELTVLFQEIGKRRITGSATEAIQTAREELALAQTDPRHLFMCGPFALASVMKNTGAKPEQLELVRSYLAEPQGTNLAEIGKLADRAKFGHSIVFRAVGQTIPIPSIVHFSVGHFAAVVGEQNGRFHVIDPVFANRESWMTLAALDAEASGYFLVGSTSSATAGLRLVGDDEAAKVWGKGPTTGTPKGTAGPQDPPANPPPNVGPSPVPPNDPPCPMCTYNIGEATVSLSLSDTPVGYVPPIGPSARVQITYNQREDSQPQSFAFFNVSPKWTLNWLTYITDDPNNLGGSVSRYIAGGGSYAYSCAQPPCAQYDAQSTDGTILVLTSQSPISYQRQLADGSVEIYAQSDGASTYPRNIFLSQVIDPQGNALTLNYDGQQRLISLTDATGKQTTFGYGLATSPLLVTQITDPFGRSAQLTYDGSGRLHSITDVIGITSSFTYDGDGLVNSLTTPYGTTNFSFSAPGASCTPPITVCRFLQATDSMGFSEREEWLEPAPVPFNDPVQPQGMPLPPKNAYLDYRDSFHWDKNAYVVAGCTPTGGCDYSQARARHFAHQENAPDTVKSTTIESVKYPLENRIWYNYPGQPDSFHSGDSTEPIAVGRVLYDGTTQLSQTSYDTAGYYRVTKQTDPVARTTSYDYPNHVDLMTVEQTTQGGTQEIVAQFQYNAQHRPLSYTDAAGQVTAYAYNPAGQIKSITDALGDKTRFQYFGNGDLKTVTNADNLTAASFTYDAYDRIRTRTDSEGYTLTYDYDAADRLTKLTYPDGSADIYTYDRLDLVTHTDRENRTWRYAYDPDRRLTSVTDPMGNQIQYGFNNNAQLTSLTDAKLNTTNWFYDVEGRLTSKAYADGTPPIIYTYDPATSRLASVLDALGQTKQYAYAQDDRLAGIAYLNAVNATPNVTYSYDPYYPRLASITDGTGTTQYTYWPVGSLGALQVKEQNTPLINGAIDYVYDELGRVHSRAVGGAGAETFGYDSIGRMNSHSSDLGQFTLGYLGESGQIASRQLANSTLATTWSYLPNVNDRRLQSINNTGLSAAQYSNYQFTTTAENFITNITQTSDISSAYPSTLVQTAAYNNVNQLTNVSGQPVTFDANGNVLADGRRNYAWDAENRLIMITYPSQPGRQTSFSYDGLSERVASISTPAGGGSSTTRLYIWCDSQPCQVRNAANTPTREYLAEGEFTPGPPAQAYYYGADQIGSVRRAFSVNGTSTAGYAYDPYGNLNGVQIGLVATDRGYAGMLRDTDSGLYLTHFRAYDPVVGRWLSRDPLGEQSDRASNLYPYVDGDPVSRIDPWGLAGIPAAPPAGVPGGPYTPAGPGQRPGTFFGPKQPSGPRQICRWVPPASEGGPPGSQGYWKTQAPGQDGWDHFNQEGEPISPEEAHPNPLAATSLIGAIIEGSPLGVFLGAFFWSSPLH
jgi:RHS repeat-associated protein